MAARKTAPVTEVTAPHSMRIITCANHKGGTGKTTTAVNVSAGLALLTQQRVLLVDCDPQGNASRALGVDMAHVQLLRDRPPHGRHDRLAGLLLGEKRQPAHSPG